METGDKVPWEEIDKAEIGITPWSNHPYKMAAFAQAAYNKNGLKIRLSAEEKEPLSRFDGLLEMVYKDSCLEFFFSPAGDKRYFNFEFNPAGSMYLGFGTDRHHSVRQVIPSYKDLFLVRPFTENTFWGIEFCIPLSFMQIYHPSLKLEKGREFRGNFYKCGEETKIPHYIVWNPIDTPGPDFHRTEFFGNLILS
jgi:hypothetical protein